MTAIDFNRTLLNELETNRQGLTITCVEDDIRHVSSYAHLQPEIIICWGDTLTHLETRDDIAKLIADCSKALIRGGKLGITF